MNCNTTHYRANSSSVPGDPTPLTLEQRTQLRGKQLSLSSRADTDAAMQWKMPSPPAFIPGGVLPMLIGELDPGPLLIRTDSFIDCESTGVPQPLGVIIRPGLDSARKVEDEDRPLRCVTAEVNGAGRVSRWYFRSTGELEIVELSGGVTLTPSDRQAIEFAFGKSGAMAP